MSKCYCSVVWIVLLNQHMAIESSHLRNGEYSDTTEGSGCNWKDLSLCDVCSKHIYIDKTYVDFEGTKYKKTFLREDGWKELCDLVFKTKFGNKCKKDDNDRMLEAYSSIIVCYLYQALSDLGFDVKNIHLEIADQSRFMVEFHKDVCEEWKTYVGPWQSWKTK